MELNELRSQIDQIDSQMVTLFEQRMALSARIGDYKKEHGLPVFVPAREREKLKEIREASSPELEAYTQQLYAHIFELSRGYQNRRNRKNSALYEEILKAIENTPKLFPQAPNVACQGLEGAYSQIACEKIFQNPYILYFKNFESVFGAIEQGLCQYGILPIENSTAGSVNKVYDLMMQHHFSIVRTFQMKIDHNLLVNPGTELSDIHEIYSHEQAISQCGSYLKNLPGVKAVPVENTAAAAQMVAQSGRKDVAAIASRSCAELYGLTCLAPSIQDQGSNRTRFICISKNLEIYPGAHRTSIMMTLNHKPGALYKVLARLYTLGINIVKLESRPIPDREFEFLFYFDLETSIYSQEYVQLLSELGDLCQEFKYLGSYTEVI